jgi:uncharacterized protein
VDDRDLISESHGCRVRKRADCRSEQRSSCGSKLASVTVAEHIHVADAPDRERYELSLDGAVIGFTAYRARPGLIAFVHTEIEDRMQGQGLADKLIRFALEDARERRLVVLPFCPFVKAFIERHREFEPLVPENYREQFGL